jgi:hypothetical protein
MQNAISAAWNARLNEYRSLRLISDELGEVDETVSDKAIDDYCRVMDDLLVQPAPDRTAIQLKIDLFKERFSEHCEAITFLDALAADLDWAPIQPSLIIALHDRYEQTWNEHNRLDNAELDLNGSKPTSPGWHKQQRLEEARSKLEREQVALTVAIAHQVPTTWQDALVLAFHLQVIDPVQCELTEGEKSAYHEGTDALLDFMFGEIDHGSVPGAFAPGQLANVEGILRNRRRMRRAQLAEAA